ncbi:hypothetical protein [Paraburkholderia lycopersici]|uniref:Uncharacterized protein n=1 Tax=Paraburkholderia lycopersici TaxID=416944 RepID=A0A1G7DMA2_9BURK|nr:hypothetical protein [Paraburkholderia lycopersici]SDE52619.1 hypothetical protein SAMN05421548_1692 [Paraburkholderia lycopersici]
MVTKRKQLIGILLFVGSGLMQVYFWFMNYSRGYVVARHGIIYKSLQPETFSRALMINIIIAAIMFAGAALIAVSYFKRKD